MDPRVCVCFVCCPQRAQAPVSTKFRGELQARQPVTLACESWFRPLPVLTRLACPYLSREAFWQWCVRVALKTSHGLAEWRVCGFPGEENCKLVTQKRYRATDAASGTEYNRLTARALTSKSPSLIRPAFRTVCVAASRCATVVAPRYGAMHYQLQLQNAGNSARAWSQRSVNGAGQQVVARCIYPRGLGCGPVAPMGSP